MAKNNEKWQKTVKSYENGKKQWKMLKIDKNCKKKMTNDDKRQKIIKND